MAQNVLGFFFPLPFNLSPVSICWPETPAAHSGPVEQRERETGNVQCREARTRIDERNLGLSHAELLLIKSLSAHDKQFTMNRGAMFTCDPSLP